MKNKIAINWFLIVGGFFLAYGFHQLSGGYDAFDTWDWKDNVTIAIAMFFPLMIVIRYFILEWKVRYHITFKVYDSETQKEVLEKFNVTSKTKDGAVLKAEKKMIKRLDGYADGSNFFIETITRL